jgi:hypothetical protein
MNAAPGEEVRAEAFGKAISIAVRHHEHTGHL